MVRKLAALAATMALACPSEAAPVTSHPAVTKVQCQRGSGTAVQIEPQFYITARHVSIQDNCRINGKPIMSLGASGPLDFDIIVAAGEPSPFYPKINCEGFKSGEVYFALGHAGGGAQRNLVVKYLPLPNPHPRGNGAPELTPLFGPVAFIPGMSGGAVFDRSGAVVGIVNAYSLIFPGLSFSRALKDTPLCQSVAGRA